MSSLSEEVEIPIIFKNQYSNLYDVFLNASLQRSSMIKSPIDVNDISLITDHFRYERTWLMFLYVFYEAWEAPLNKSFRQYVYNLPKSKSIQTTISDLKKTRQFVKLKNLRDYMAHRDKRIFWDTGRTDILNNLSMYNQFHQTFSDFFLLKKKFID